MSAADDAASAGPVLAIVRAAGLQGFKSGAAAMQPEPPSSDRTDDEASADPVLALVRAAGLSGFGASATDRSAPKR